MIMGACPASTQESRTLLFVWRVLTLSPGEERQLDFSLPRGICDRPATSSVMGIYRGHYRAGYETTLFLPCPAPGVPGRLIGHQRDSSGVIGTHAWVSYRAGVRVRWEDLPEVPRDRGLAVYYVQWRGTLSGPGSYGHMGVAEYAFQVDSILEMRAPGAGDCAEKPSRAAP
jgi:hypothetical protein